MPPKIKVVVKTNPLSEPGSLSEPCSLPGLRPLRAISLFSGMGGDSLGLVQAGFDLVAYCEKERVFRATHDMNFEKCISLGASCEGDITKIPDSEFAAYKDQIDIIFASTPCQPHSKAGKRKIDDPRKNVFFDFLRSLVLIQPKYFICENVKGLLTSKTPDGSQLYMDMMRSEFNNAGYSMKYQLIKTEKYGIPQKRERVIIIGMRTVDMNNEGGMDRLQFPPETSTTVGLQDIVTFDMTGAIEILPTDFDMTSIPEECLVTDMTNDEGENPESPPHPYLKLKAKTRGESYDGTTHNNMLSFGKRASPIHCEIIDIRKPAKTIICTYDHQPRLFVPLRNKRGYFLRCLLPIELKQIQGFPIDYEIAGNLKQQIVQIGNSVPPGIIRQVVTKLLL